MIILHSSRSNEVRYHTPIAAMLVFEEGEGAGTTIQLTSGNLLCVKESFEEIEKLVEEYMRERAKAKHPAPSLEERLL